MMMKKLLLLCALLTAGALGLQETSQGHGGTYRGPGDTVPPGGGGGGGGGGPATPGPAGPATPGPSGPSTPGPASPGTPGGAGPARPSTGGGAQAGPDLTVWQFWWGFNKDPYLNLKAHIHSASTLTGSDEFFLGQGQQTSAKDNLRPSEETIRQKVVPALLDALDKETNNDIVTACLMALAKIGDSESEDGVSKFEQVIRPFLSDANQEIKETAALALGILANPASIETLLGIMNDMPDARALTSDEGGINYRTRAFAAYGLGLIGNRTEDIETRRTIVRSLWEILESPRQSTRDVKVGALIALGLVPLDIGPAAVEDEATDEGELTIEDWTRKEQIAYLIEFFLAERDKDKHYLVRAHAPHAIALLLDGAPEFKTQVVDALVPFVRKRAPGQAELRQSCTLAFGQIGDLDEDPEDKQIRAALIDAVGNSDAQTKNFSIISAGQVGGRPGTGDTPLAGEKEMRAHLMKHLSRGKSQLKPWAGLAIGVMERSLLDKGQTPSSDALGALRIKLREEGAPSQVGAYAIGLGIARDSESASLLLEKLDRISQDEPRGDIAVALGLMNAAEAIEPIQKIVQASKYRSALLKSAAISLGLLGDKNAVPELTSMLRNEAKTLSTQAAIASALGFIGDSRSIDPLVEMLQSTDVTAKARAFAGVALGIVADKETLPWNSKISVDINYRANTTTLTSASDGTGVLDIL